MDVFSDYLAGIANVEHQARMEEVLSWVSKKYPNLKPRVAWNQPMFTDHDTFIIGFSVAKHHLAVAPERAGIHQFSAEILAAGYDHTQELFRIRWDRPVDFQLLGKIIEFNMIDKANCSTFWRK